MKTPILLDLFCGAGGAARGYTDAGFACIGVDIAPQMHYPYPFYQGDALTVLAILLKGQATFGEGLAAMGIDWMCIQKELANAIPPAYTRWIGTQLLTAIQAERAGMA